MAKSPFFEILLKEPEERITEKYGIFAMSFERSFEKDNKLELSVNSKNIAVLQDAWVQKGSELIFYYGTREGENLFNQSPKHLVKVSKLTNVNINNAGHTSFTVLAFDQGHFVKKRKSVKIWKNKTASEIIKEICDFHLLKTLIKPTTKRYENFPQANLTDWEFMKLLKSRENDYDLWVNGETLYFQPNNYKQESSFTIRLGDTENGLEKLTIEFPEQKEQADETTITTLSPSGEPLTKKIDKDSAEGNTRLNDFPIPYDEDAKLKSRKPAEAKNRTGTKLATADKDPQVISNMVNNAYKEAERKSVIIHLSLEGSKYSNVSQGTIFTLADAALFTGNYFITDVKDVITGGGAYRVSIKAQSNTLRKPISKTETEKVIGSKNKTTGETGKVKRKILYDQNSNAK